MATSKKQSKKLTYQDVSDACFELVKMGQVPTTINLLKFLERGSSTTIQKFRVQWEATEDAQIALGGGVSKEEVTIPDDFKSDADSFVLKVWVRARAEHDAAIAKNTEEKERAIAAARAEARDWQEFVGALEEKIEQFEIQEIEFKQQMGAVEVENGRLQARLDESISKVDGLNMELQASETELAELADTVTGLEQRIALVTQEREQALSAIEQIKVEHAKEIESLRGDHVETVSELKSEHAEAMKSIKAENNQSITELNAKHVKEIESLRGGHVEAVSELKSEHAEAMKSIKADHKNSIKELRSEHSASVKEIAESNKQYINDLKIAHEQTTAALREALQDCQNSRDSLAEKLETLTKGNDDEATTER